MAVTDEQAKQTIAAAQSALHSIYGRDKTAATRLYNDLQTWARSGHKAVIGHHPDPGPSLLEAHAILLALLAKGGQDAADAQAIGAVLHLPAPQVIKLGGFAPASTNPAAVSQNFTKSAEAAIAANPLAALFQANLWLRVAEVALGLVLLAVGVAKLTNAVPIATKIAAAVG